MATPLPSAGTCSLQRIRSLCGSRAHKNQIIIVKEKINPLYIETGGPRATVTNYSTGCVQPPADQQAGKVLAAVARI